MPSYTTFVLETFPARTADLEFEMEVPQQWLSPELPPASDDYSDPTLFLPLMLRVAPMSPVILAVAARPAYENGTIYDWVPYLIEQQQYQPLAMGEGTVGALKAMIGSARQPTSDIGPRHLRFAFFEDGGRLINIFLSTPEGIEREAEDVWQSALKSFRLARPRGQSAHPTVTPTEPPQAQAEQSESAPAEVLQDDGFVPERDKPEWWNRARRLELANKLKEAEQAIKDGVPHAAFCLLPADLYRRRMNRLAKAGDADGAQHARKEAIDWIYFYASQATSGGEGAAFSGERDRFMAELGE
jgi:hypothetical protein